MAGTEGKWYVAAVKGTSKEVRSKHTNHLPISNVHIATSITSIPEGILEDIKRKIQSGTSPTSIVTEFKDKYKVTIFPKQVITMKQNIVQDLVHSAGEDPSYSSAEHLIQVFRNYMDVSYVYVKHHLQSGFVTYRKKRGSTQQVVENDINLTEQASTVDEITLWRQELKLGDNNEILVAFAWSHNEETRKLSMFPEFIAVDLTFGMNRQKLPFLVVSAW